ncbi:MAG: inositol monophosphatase family protein [Gammaproteobacteria bacterium]|nr:MAG: inositol monophosphatase family protein [Gammaproteobacteria bacterium]
MDKETFLIEGFGDSRQVLSRLSELVIQTSARNGLLKTIGDRQATEKTDGSLVTEADQAIERRIRAELESKWPGMGFLGEEGGGNGSLWSGDLPFWCLDPLDGTTNFSRGLPFYAVSLALIHRGRPVLGVVYDPVRNECFSSAAGQGAWLNGVSIQVNPTDLSEAVAIVDFKRLPEGLSINMVLDPPYRSQRNLGSCALEWCWLASGRAQFCVHGGQQPWDMAAGYLTLMEAGGSAQDLEGKDLILRSYKQSVIAAASTSLLSEWRRWQQGCPGVI